ncbi:MAG TPA: hypothetical protein DEA08_30120 [Planctomycetes bacterium]|nr:hypothetical protein [Planctomycetota bacterium]
MEDQVSSAAPTATPPLSRLRCLGLGLLILVALATLALSLEVAVAVSSFRSGNTYAFNGLFVRSWGEPLARRELRSGSTPTIRARAAEALDTLQVTNLDGSMDPIHEATFTALLEAARSDESPLVRAAAFAKVFRWGKGRRSKAELRALAERFLADQEPIPYGGQEHTLGWAEEAWRKAGRPEEDFTPAVLTHFLVRVVLARSSPREAKWPPADMSAAIEALRAELAAQR